MLWLSLTFNVLWKALYQCNYATTAVAAHVVAAVGLQVQYGPQTEGRISQRVSGLSHDSMCGSWFSSVLKCVWCGLGLVSLLFTIIFFIWIHLFLNLHVGVTATCSAGLLVCSFRASFLRLLCSVASTSTNAQNTQGPHSSLPPRLSLTRSLCPPHTPTHSTTPKTSPQTLSPPTTPSLCSAASVPPHLLTDFLVFLQSRKASEQAKSVDSKTDSIGSGRAIPIKQVSRFIIIPLYLISCYMGEYDPFSLICCPILFHALWNRQRCLFNSMPCVSITTRWQHGTKIRPALCDWVERGGQ